MHSGTRSVLISIVGILAGIGLILGAGYAVARRLGDDVGGFRIRRPAQEVESARTHRSASRSVLTSSLESLAGFDTIRTIGGWSVSVTQGDGFAVNVSASEKAMDQIRVFQRGETLHFELGSGIQSVTGNLTATVTMPDLERLELEGGSNVDLSALDVDRLEVFVSGAANIVGHGGSIDDLSIDSDGAGAFNFADVSVTNADVELDGVSTMRIHMAGGDLTGVIRGAGEVTFSGDVSEERVRVEGLGRVRRD